jgi:uncharacterized membrane protein YhaH (DUF805 family)
MDWKALYLDANGRIGQKDFWIGLAIIVAVWVVCSFIPLLGQIVQLVLIYAGVCVMSKRLHDMGKTGWLAAVPYGLLAVAMVLTLVTVIGAMTAAGLSQNTGDAAVGVGAAAAVGMAGLVMLLAGLVGLGFVLWVGLTKGDPTDNQYGPPPRSLIGGDANPTAV